MGITGEHQRPPTSSIDTLCQQFSDFFVKKIADIRHSLHSQVPDMPDNQMICHVILTD